MTVTDSHDGTLSQISDSKQCREGENPQTLTSPEHGGTDKRKKKRKKRNDESNEQSQIEVCPKPLVDLLLFQEENGVAALDNPNPIYNKKKTKNLHGEQQLHPSNSSIGICVVSDDTQGEEARQGDANGNRGLCPNPLVDRPIPIAPREENGEATAQNHCSIPKKKKSLPVAEQICDSSILIGVEPGFTREKGSRQGDANGNGILCPKPVVTLNPIVSHEENAKATAQDHNSILKKTLPGAEQICDSSILIGVEPGFTKEKGSRQGDANGNGVLCPKPVVTLNPIVSHEENAKATAQDDNSILKKKTLLGAEQLCDPGDNGNEGFCPKTSVDTQLPIVPREESAEATAQNPTPNPKKKRKRKKKKKSLRGAEQMCDPSVQIGVELDVRREEREQQGSETSTQNPNATPKRKRRNNVENELQQLQTCDPSIPIYVEPEVKKGEGAHRGDANEAGISGINEERLVPDATAPENTHWKNDSSGKKEKVFKPDCSQPEVVLQLDTATPSDLELKQKAQPIEAKIEYPQTSLRAQHTQPQPSSNHAPAVRGINEECPAPDPAPLEHTHQKKRTRKKKSVLNLPRVELQLEPEPKPKESNNTEHPQQCTPYLELKVMVKIGAEANVDHSQVCPQPELAPPLDITTPNVTVVEKRVELTEANVENPQACSKPELASLIDLPAPTGPEKKQQAYPIKIPEKHTQLPKSQPCAEPLVDSTTPIDLGRREHTNKRVIEKIMCSEEKVGNHGSPLHMDITLNLAPDPGQQDPASSLSSQPVSLTDQAIPVDPAIPIDSEQKMKKKIKQRETVVVGEEEPNHNKCDTEQPKVTIQKSTFIEAPPIDPTIKMDHCLAVPMCPTNSTDIKQEISKKNRKKKRKGGMRAEKKKETEPSEAHVQHPQPSIHEPAVRGINEKCPAPDPAPLAGPHPKKKRRKRKSVLNLPRVELQLEPEPKESNNIEHPQECTSSSELKVTVKIGTETNADHSQVCPKPELAPPLDIANPNDTVVEKRAEPSKANVEGPQACSKLKLASLIDLPAPTGPEKEQETYPFKIPEEHTQLPKPQLCAEPPSDLTTPNDQSRRKQKNKRVIEKIMCSEEKEVNYGSPLHMDITLNVAPDLVQQDPTTPLSLQPASLIDQTIVVDPAIPTDAEQKMKRKIKQRETVVEGEEEPSHNKCDTEQPKVTIQNSTCLIEAPPIDPAIKMNHCLTFPMCPTNSKDIEPEISNTNRKKKRKSARKSEVAEANKQNSEAAEPNERNGKLNEVPSGASAQQFVYPITVPSNDQINSIGAATLIDTTTPIDQGQEMTKKKRKKKRNRRSHINEGAEPNEPDDKQPETAVQGFVYPIVAPSMDLTISAQPLPIDTVTPIDQDKKTCKEKSKRSALISEGAELNEHDGKPAETPVQQSIYPIAAPSIESAIPTGQAPQIDPATPVDPEQMTKRKRSNSALKNEFLESLKHNTDPTAETPVHETKRTKTKKFMGRCNADLAAKAPVQRTESLKVTRSSFKRRGESSMGKCNAQLAAETPVGRVTRSVSKRHSERSSQQIGQKLKKCDYLKCLSNGEEVCFFCGEMGHSLGNCGLSHAGGRRFAKCLLCHEHGHFSYNCPQSGHKNFWKEK